MLLADPFCDLSLFILAMVPSSLRIYPLMGKFFTVTPLRKIAIVFRDLSLYLIVASIREPHHARQTGACGGRSSRTSC